MGYTTAHNMFKEVEPDMVNHPPHYKTANGLETIDVIEAFTADLKGIEATDTSNVIKYICRWKNKNGLQDLQKAKWYLEHLIKHIEKEEEKQKEFLNKQFNLPEEKNIRPELGKLEPFIFDTRLDAEKFVNDALDAISVYGFVSVADLYDLYLDRPRIGTLNGHKYGYRRLEYSLRIEPSGKCKVTFITNPEYID